MTRFLIYLLLLGMVLYSLSMWGRRREPEMGGIGPEPNGNNPKSNKWFRPKRNPMETWMQVYETADMQEAKSLQARIQEEEIECIVYEQGKKDIHGNSLTGIGIAVPKTAVGHAQRIISRMPS